MRAKDDRKATPGITELSRARVHIDLEACYFAVGSSHPGYAQTLFFFKKKEKRLRKRKTLRGKSSQGWGCSPIKEDRELGSERREPVWLISAGSVGHLRGRSGEYERNTGSGPLVNQCSDRDPE